MTGSISVRGEDGVVPETQSAAQEVPADATTVRIVNLAFDPAEVTITTGTTVSWTNEDSVPHTVTSTDGAFDSGIFDPGANFTWTFDQPGSFPYACQIHPQMQGYGDRRRRSGGERCRRSPPPSSQTEPAAAQAAAPAEAAVSIVDFSFEPATLDVAAGTTVVWTNDGQAPHTVTGDFADSGVLEPGQTFSHTFAESGEFSYACAIHPQMTGTIRVSAAAAAESTPTAPSAARYRTRGRLVDPAHSRRRGDSRRAPGVWPPFTMTARSKPISPPESGDGPATDSSLPRVGASGCVKRRFVASHSSRS